MAAMNSDEEAQASVYEWAIFSPYSPLNLQHLPQPMPSEMRQLVSEGISAEESHFTFRDAFEDLLLHTKHPDNGSWPKAPRDYNYVVNAPAARQHHLFDVVDWTSLIGTLDYWGYYFPHLPAKPLRWTGLQYDEPLMHSIEDMVRRRFRTNKRALDLVFVPNTPKYKCREEGKDLCKFMHALDDDQLMSLMIQLPAIQYETLEVDRELHQVYHVYENPLVEEDFYLRTHSHPVAEARLPNLSSEVKDTWHGQQDTGRTTADGGSCYTIRHIQESREGYSIRELTVYVDKKGQLHAHEDTVRHVRSSSPSFWGTVWQNGQAKMKEPNTCTESLTSLGRKPEWGPAENSGQRQSLPFSMTTNPTESGPPSNQ